MKAPRRFRIPRSSRLAGRRSRPRRGNGSGATRAPRGGRGRGGTWARPELDETTKDRFRIVLRVLSKRGATPGPTGTFSARRRDAGRRQPLASSIAKRFACHTCVSRNRSATSEPCASCAATSFAGFRRARRDGDRSGFLEATNLGSCARARLRRCRGAGVGDPSVASSASSSGNRARAKSTTLIVWAAISLRAASSRRRAAATAQRVRTATATARRRDDGARARARSPRSDARARRGSCASPESAHSTAGPPCLSGRPRGRECKPQSPASPRLRRVGVRSSF